MSAKEVEAPAFKPEAYTSQATADGKGNRPYWRLTGAELQASFEAWRDNILDNSAHAPDDNVPVYVNLDRKGNVSMSWPREVKAETKGNIAPPPAELDTTIRKWAEYVAKGGKAPVPPEIADTVARLLKPAAPPAPPALMMPPALEAPAKVGRRRRA